MNKEAERRSPLVKIVWRDAFGCSSSWQELNEINLEPLECRSVGWLVHDGKDCKVIVPHLSAGHPNANPQGCGDMTIPTCAVVSIVRLGETPEGRERISGHKQLPLTSPRVPGCGPIVDVVDFRDIIFATRRHATEDRYVAWALILNEWVEMPGMEEFLDNKRIQQNEEER